MTTAPIVHGSAPAPSAFAATTLGVTPCGQIPDEPVTSQRGDLLERPRLLEQVSGSGHDHELGLATQPRVSHTIESYHLGIEAADDQQRRGADKRERVAREV